MSDCFEPMRGVKVWCNEKGALVFRLHYSADLQKNEAWAAARRAEMAESFYQQEFEIDFGATSGQKLYNIEDQYTLEDDFPIPAHWTRYFVLDPGRAKPHACIWAAIDPENFIHIYRELWPSKVYNKKGGVPENDNVYTPREYAETVAWFESSENPKNYGKRERIYERIIDYFARTQREGSVTMGQAPGANMQELFEQAGYDIAAEGKYPGFDFRFTDARKDQKDVSIDIINTALRPLEVLKGDGSGREKRSRIQIFRSACPELIWQLHNNRKQVQTTHQKSVSDPEIKKVNKRNDLSDCLCYLMRHDPEYVAPPSGNESTWVQAYSGVSY